MLDDVLAVRGAGAGPVLVEQQPRRLALRIGEELEPAAYLQVEGDREGAGTQARQPVVLTLANFMRSGSCAHQRNRTLLSIVSNVVRNASLGEALRVRAQASSVLLPTGITAIRLMNSGWGP